MNFESGSRNHAQFNLDGGITRGRTNLIHAAKDPVQPPQEPAVVSLLARCLCICKVGHNEYVVKSAIGTEVGIPFGAPFAQWQAVCEQLLATAMQP